MKRLFILALLVLSAPVFATGQNHECQGGHNCNTYNDIPPQGGGDAEANATAVAVAGASSSSSANSTNLNLNSNTATGGNAYSEGGDATAIGIGGDGGNAEQSQGQLQGQSQSSDNSNSSNNSSSQSTNLNFEGTGEASHYNQYGNNVGAYAPVIYSSSACTAGGLSGGASAFGMGIALGGAKQDPQCQVRENARIMAGLNVDLAIMYLCANPAIDVGAVLGSACKPPIIVVPPVVIPEPETKPVLPEVLPVDVDVKG